jgi:hypothetical protein
MGSPQWDPPEWGSPPSPTLPETGVGAVEQSAQETAICERAPWVGHREEVAHLVVGALAERGG